ncbi:hypothetical protein JW824_13475 [bacterium]|nr:hypothetical protein [bacterium]
MKKPHPFEIGYCLLTIDYLSIWQRPPVAWEGRSRAVKVLLENGANVNAISNYNKTPLDCALKPMEWKYASPLGKRKSVSLIKKYGGKKAVELKKP